MQLEVVLSGITEVEESVEDAELCDDFIDALLLHTDEELENA